MKSLFTYTLALFICALGLAQSPVAPVLYSELEEAVEMVYSFTSPNTGMPATSGTNQVWDFSALDLNDASLSTNTSTVNVPANNAIVPMANVGLEVAEFGNTSVLFQEAPGGIYLWGFELFAVYFTDPQLSFPFGLTYGDTVSDYYSSTGGFGDEQGTVFFEYIAHGEVRVPGKTFPDVALLLEVDGSDTTYSFANIGFDVIDFKLNPDGSMSTLDISYVQTVVLGNEVTSQKQPWFAKNDNELTLSEHVHYAELMDLNGRPVSTSSNHRLHFEGKGLYLLKGETFRGEVLTEKVWF